MRDHEQTLEQNPTTQLVMSRRELLRFIGRLGAVVATPGTASILTACNRAPGAEPQPAAAAPLGPPRPEIPGEKWSHYENRLAGYALDYPSSWIKDSYNQQPDFAEESFRAPGIESWQVLAISHSPVKHPDINSYKDSVVQKMRRNVGIKLINPDLNLPINEREISVAGQRALELSVSIPPDSTKYNSNPHFNGRVIFMANGQEWEILAGVRDIETLRRMAKSFQFHS